MSFSTNDVNLKIAISSEKVVTLDEIVKEASSIYAKCKKRKLTFGDEKAAEALLSEMQKAHPQLSKSYPIVLRYICQMQEYSPQAFRKYLIKIKLHPWKSEGEYLESQTDYVVMLYQTTHKHWNQTDVNKIRKNILAMLKNEHEVFTKYAKEFKDEVDKEEEMFTEQSDNAMREFYAIHGEDALHVPIVMSTDISTEQIVSIDTITCISDSNASAAEMTTDVSADDLLM
jgi:protein-tyrosine-phosphatase